MTAKITSLLLGSLFTATSCLAQLPAASIDQDDVARIIKTLSADEMQGRAAFSAGAEKAATFIETEFRNIGLSTLSGADSYRQVFQKGDVVESGKDETRELFNVVGVLPGKSKADEIVVISAHYDHIGIIEPLQGDSIANGADDDASGVTAVISLAKYFKKLDNNERTLVFVTFTAEELGGFGSRYFSQKVKPESIVAMFNIEMIGKDSKFGRNTAYITGFDKSDLGQILQRNLKGTAFRFYADPYPKQNLFYRSDNATLAKFGVPAHTISTVQIEKDDLYHTVNDEIDSLDIANITATIEAIALSSRSIVAGTDTPRRIVD